MNTWRILPARGRSRVGVDVAEARVSSSNEKVVIIHDRETVEEARLGKVGLN